MESVEYLPQPFVVKQERRANPVIDQLNKLLVDVYQLIEDEDYNHPTFSRAEKGVIHGITNQLKMILANYK